MAIASDTAIRSNKTIAELELSIDLQILPYLGKNVMEVWAFTTSYCSEDDCKSIVEIYTSLGWSIEKRFNPEQEAILTWVLKRND